MSGRVWRRAEALAHVESPGRAVVVRLGQLSEPPVILEGTSAEIWNLVDGERTEGQIVAELAAAYDVREVAIAGDVAVCLAQLKSLGLLSD